ncbi:MAG: ComEA family DNA-binding protein [Planctomycetota bacterium]|jgi:competence protein ComEA
MDVAIGDTSPKFAATIALTLWACIQAVAGGIEAARAPASPRLPPALVPDVNRAPEGVLMLLPRVGPARARAIVRERERGGPFASIADLERVRGLGPVTVAGLLPLATAGDP